MAEAPVPGEAVMVEVNERSAPHAHRLATPRRDGGTASPLGTIMCLGDTKPPLL